MFHGSPDDLYGIYAIIYVRNMRCHACDTQTVESSAVFCLSRIRTNFSFNGPGPYIFIDSYLVKKAKNHQNDHYCRNLGPSQEFGIP